MKTVIMVLSVVFAGCMTQEEQTETKEQHTTTCISVPVAPGGDVDPDTIPDCELASAHTIVSDYSIANRPSPSGVWQPFYCYSTDTLYTCDIGITWNDIMYTLRCWVFWADFPLPQPSCVMQQMR